MVLSTANWMSGLDGKLLLSEITLPGTHDSSTQYCAMSRIARCQNTSVKEQLENGFRFIDIRLCRRGGQMFCVHGAVNCKNKSGERLTFDSVIKICTDFLKNNPSETIVMSVKQDRGRDKNEFAKALSDNYYSRGAQMWHLENRTPSLEEARGKIVLMRRYLIKKDGDLTNSGRGMNFSLWPDQKSKKSTQGYVFDMQSNNGENTGRLISVQDRYSFPPDEKWNLCILPMLKEPYDKGAWRMNFMSTMSGGCPKNSSEKINSHFDGYDLSKGRHGVIICDFATADLAEKIYKTNFKF